MADAGLSTPLHLAASLLALFASAGLAIIILARPGMGLQSRPRHAADWTLAAGGFSFAVGHGLAGALLPGTATVIPWLHAIGLLLIAAGLSRPRLTELTGAAVIVPVAITPEATVVALIGGVVGAARAMMAGRSGIPIAAGLLAWGGAAVVRQSSIAWAATLTLIGAFGVGWWLWHASARALRAKLVTASVALLLAVVVLIASALSGLGSRDLVDDELERLHGLAETVAGDLQTQWSTDAINAAKILGNQPGVRANARNGTLQPIYEAFFQGPGQDFLIILNSAGQTIGSYAPGSDTASGELPNGFLLQVQGAPFVEDVLAGETQGGSLLLVGGEFVAAGGVPIKSAGARAEEAPLGAVITGRRADAAWAARARRQLNTNVVVAAGNGTAVGPAEVAPVAQDIATSFSADQDRAAMTVDGRPLYAAAAPIEDPEVGGVIGRAIAVSEAGALAALEQSQARRLFLLALIGAVLSGAAAAFVSKRLVAPIRQLTAIAAAVREGNLDVAADLRSADEVGVLGRTFDEMTRSLSSQSAQLRDAASVQGRLRARLEALTSSMSDGLLAVNPDGKVVTFNPAAQRLVGRDITEVLGLPMDQVLIGRAPGGHSPTEALGAFDSEQTRAVQLLLERSDGRLVPTAVTAAPMHDMAGGVILGRVYVLRDVTREVEIERMKTEFLSNVSHELRTPLTPIKGYAEVLARRDVGAEATRKFADQILDSTGRLERIVATIVDFAALDSGRLELRPEPVDLHDLVEQLFSEWRSTYPDREFRRRIARTLPSANVDLPMLRRCLDELIANAVKFSPDGGPISLLATETTYGPDDQSFVRLSVRDRGVGIEGDLAARIFSDFYQADASETRHYGGLGLGLALVRRIVEGMDGHIDLDSRPGEGSTFHLLLPAASPPE
jgi:PAS domain S-box-containing protein